MMRIAFFIACLIACVFGGCEPAAQDEAASKTECRNGETTVGDNFPADALRKLRKLNEWESKYGNRVTKRPDYDVPGEAQAHMDLLKNELLEMGYIVDWDARKAEYVLVQKKTGTKE